MNVRKWVSTNLSIDECIAIINENETEVFKSGGLLEMEARKFSKQLEPAEIYLSWRLPLLNACYREVALLYIAQST